MTSQLNYLIAQQRQAELVSHADRARLASDAHLSRSASPPRWNVGRLLSTRRLKAPHVPQLRGRQTRDRPESA
jgi:hypothetical protein